MLEFSDLILGPFTSYLKSNILLSIGLIVALFAYFGYFCDLHQVEAAPYRKSVYGMSLSVKGIYNFAWAVPLDGMFFTIFYLGTYLYAFYLLFFFRIIPTSLLFIRSDLWSGVVKLIAIFYVVFICYDVFLKSQKCDSEFTYKKALKARPFYKHFLKSDNQIQNINSICRNVERLWGENKKLLLGFILYSTLFGWLRPFILFVFAYLILLSNTSLITGLFIYAHIFLAFTFIAIDKGIGPDSFRYAEIFLKDSKKTEKGRVRSIDSNSIDLLKKKKDDTTFLIVIPMVNVLKMELRELEEV